MLQLRHSYKCRKSLEDGCGWKTFREYERDVLAHLEHFIVRDGTVVIYLSQDTWSSDPDLKTIPPEQKNTVFSLSQHAASKCRTD